MFEKFNLYSFSAAFNFKYDSQNKALIYEKTTTGNTPEYLTSGATFKKFFPVTSIFLDRQSVSLELTNTTHLNATILPVESSIKTIQWSSSNPSVASVDSTGKIMTHGVGKAIITASAGDKKASCNVSVYKKEIVTPPLVDPVDEIAVGINDKISLETINSTVDKIINGEGNHLVSNETLSKVQKALGEGMSITTLIQSKTITKNSLSKETINRFETVLNKLLTTNQQANITQYLDLSVGLMVGSAKLGDESTYRRSRVYCCFT